MKEHYLNEIREQCALMLADLDGGSPCAGFLEHHASALLDLVREYQMEHHKKPCPTHETLKCQQNELCIALIRLRRLREVSDAFTGEDAA